MELVQFLTEKCRRKTVIQLLSAAVTAACRFVPYRLYLAVSILPTARNSVMGFVVFVWISFYHSKTRMHCIRQWLYAYCTVLNVAIPLFLSIIKVYNYHSTQLFTSIVNYAVTATCFDSTDLSSGWHRIIFKVHKVTVHIWDPKCALSLCTP
jgi:F0F1-type ATP synthase assembly protein I